MSFSENYEYGPETDENNFQPTLDHNNFFDFNCKSYGISRKFLVGIMKYSLLSGADKVLMSKRASTRSKGFNELLSSSHRSHLDHDDANLDASEKKIIARYHIRKSDDILDVSNVVKYPLKFLIFLAVLVLKLISLQFSLFTSFFTAPIWLTYSLIVFPFQTLVNAKKFLIRRLSRMWFELISSIYSRFLVKKSILNLGVKFSRALFWVIGVCFVLIGLLLSGFLVGSIITSYLVEKPIQTTEALNFDYTKESPVAFVPVNPYNHKLQLTVVLTLPESEYNMKLGMFQVSVELLSSNGLVTASSSHPCMLKFKSPMIRFIETIFKTAPLIAGYQSESQILKIKILDIAKGNVPSGYLRVTLAQRAEYKPGVGIPQIYDANLELESELSKFKKMVWFWRRVIFVWISFAAFWSELVIVLILFRSRIIPRGKVYDSWDHNLKKKIGLKSMD